jgi:proton-translocating NADH-quinone oxidoreductase chain M
MISLLFVLLTGFLFIIVFLSLFSVEMLELKIYYLVIYLLYFILVNIFITQNLIWFFAFFESSVFPMFIIILMGGSRVQKFKAAYYFFFFTVIGSIFMFISINYIFFRLGTVNICELMFVMHELSIFEQRLIWLSFFLSFAIKVPMFPFHTWLPEAHVEAPTIGSVLLAGILLKLGIYGFIRVSFFLLPEANVFFSTYVYILALISIFYSCIIAIRQTDIKRIIAYASIAHMNLIILGLFSFSSVGIYGAIFQSISHGLVSSALFLLVGMLYSRYKSRIINYYSGLTQVMPIFSFFFLLFTLANISFPLTSNFMGELLLFVGISKLSLGILILSLFGIILNTIYSLWFCNRIIYGNVKSHLLIKFKDLNFLEIFILSLLLFIVVLLGIFPNMIGGITLPLQHYSLLFVIKTLSVIHTMYL